MRYLHLSLILLAAFTVALCVIQHFRQCGTSVHARNSVQHHTEQHVPPEACEDRAPDGDRSGCLQQALWGKCSEPFMQQACDRSCGRCSSALRGRLLQHTTVVSARQGSPCSSPNADLWVTRALANKAEYARAHGMQLAWSNALLDGAYEGAWNKVVYLHRLVRAALRSRAHKKAHAEWLLWCDWDVIFTDLSWQLPLEEYEATGARLVIGGDPTMLATTSADYLKLNTGVMLLRVHEWTQSLLERMLRIGRPEVRRRHALALQSRMSNLCVGCIDDQAVLLSLLVEEPQRWSTPFTVLERRYLLQAHWEDISDMLPGAMPFTATEDAATNADVSLPLPLPLRDPLADVVVPLLQRPFFGHVRVPLAVHFAGCQLCSGKASPERVAKCWPSFRRVLRFAEEQTLRPLGKRHSPWNRSAPGSAPLLDLQEGKSGTR